MFTIRGKLISKGPGGHILSYPANPSRRTEIEAILAVELCPTYFGLGIAILLIQIGMLLMLLCNPSEDTTSQRRAGYFILHSLLIVCDLLFLLCIHARRRKDTSKVLHEGIVFSTFCCLIICVITLLDLTGGKGLIHYCYALPTLAALILLPPVGGLILFGSSCLLVNFTLLLLPNFYPDPIGTFLHSVVISALSAYISITGYHGKVCSQESQIIIQEQYDKIKIMNQKLMELAHTDQLTSVHNRRYLEGTIREMLGEPSKIGMGVAGIMVDIDFFKQYNDNYGHCAGDRCLQELAQRLVTFAEQERAMMVRYGGEEFFLCLFDCDETSAQQTAERLRCAIAQCRFPRDDVPDQILTVSVGLCYCPPQELPALDDLIYRADAALYRAKKEGRNRISTFCHCQ